MYVTSEYADLESQFRVDYICCPGSLKKRVMKVLVFQQSAGFRSVTKKFRLLPSGNSTGRAWRRLVKRRQARRDGLLRCILCRGRLKCWTLKRWGWVNCTEFPRVNIWLNVEYLLRVNESASRNVLFTYPVWLNIFYNKFFVDSDKAVKIEDLTGFLAVLGGRP